MIETHIESTVRIKMDIETAKALCMGLDLYTRSGGYAENEATTEKQNRSIYEVYAALQKALDHD